MPFIPQEKVQQALEMDLMTYLRINEPDELVHFSGNTYCTRTHDSLKISNGKWMWWSRGIGGHNAVDYLIKVHGLSFLEAVERIVGTGSVPTHRKTERPLTSSQRVILPARNTSSDIVREYLTARCIDPEIIDYCITAGILYESLPHHSAIFVGYDDLGTPRYAAYRATDGSRLLGDASGSDKHFSFQIINPSSEEIHVFESAIDALSYATIMKLSGSDWRAFSYLSLAGVYTPNKDPQKTKIPAALQKCLDTHRNVRRIFLHLDNDDAGRSAAAALKTVLQDRYEVIDAPPDYGKDFNDFLCFIAKEEFK